MFSVLENKELFPVEKMCYCMKGSKNAYHHWLKIKDQPTKETTTTYLKNRIIELFNENREVYGSYRIKEALERDNLFYSRS